jgi:polar amino acid transport system substrate-binding protein
MDKKSSLDPMSLVKAVDSIVGEMHKDGTLTKLSKKWYDGVDLTKRR